MGIKTEIIMITCKKSYTWHNNSGAIIKQIAGRRAVNLRKFLTGVSR